MPVCRQCHRELPEGAASCSSCGAAQPRSEEAGDSLVGATIAGKYFVHELLGRGGMAEVYKATELGPDRPLALKILRGSPVADPEKVRRFRREAAAASRLRHRNSIEVLDFGTAEDGSVYLAMEFVPGCTLARLIADRAPLPESRVVHIAAQILSAIAEAHSLGIIHRDLKPANVLLDPLREGTDFVKVADFGIAILGSHPGAEDRLTQDGVVYGTPAYMSPEQIRGEALDARSDLYAVGVMLFEMLTGSTPFEAATPMAIAAKHLTDPPPSLAARRGPAAVVPGLEALVARALEKDRELRPRSAEDMRAELLASVASLPEAARAPPRCALPPTEAFAAGGAAPAHPAGPSAESRAGAGESAPASRRGASRRRAALAIGALAAVVLGGAIVLPRARRAHLPPAPGAAEPQTSGPPLESPPEAAAPALPSAPARPPEAVSRPAPGGPASHVRRAPAAASAGRRLAGRGRAEGHSPAPPPAIKLVRGELNSLSTPPAATGDGVLVLEAEPWAEVSLDGTPLGETPREVRLRAGSYTVRAVHPELGVREEGVAVGAGERKRWATRFGQ